MRNLSSIVESNRSAGSTASSPDAVQPTAPPSTSASATWLDGGLAVLNKRGEILSLNDSLAMWFEATPGELTGQSLAKLLGHRDAAWEKSVSEFLAQSATFDRLELPSQRATQRLALEICRHADSQFVRLESVLPPARELEELFPEGWARLMPEDDRPFLNQFAARGLWSILVHRPGRRTGRSIKPYLAICTEHDTVASLKAAEHAADIAPLGEMVRVKGGHFDVYKGGISFDEGLKAQLEFLKRVVPLSKK